MTTQRCRCAASSYVWFARRMTINRERSLGQESSPQGPQDLEDEQEGGRIEFRFARCGSAGFHGQQEAVEGPEAPEPKDCGRRRR
jgi:hypothetical protein